MNRPCVDAETQYFNGKCWEYIRNYKDWEQVLQYRDGIAQLVYPTEFIHYESDDPFYEQENYGVSICQTGNYNLLTKGSDGVLYTVNQLDALKQDIYVTVNCRFDGDLKLSKEEIDKIICGAEVNVAFYNESLFSLPLVDKFYMMLEILRINGTNKDGKTFWYKSDRAENVKFVATLASLIGFTSSFFTENYENVTLYRCEDIQLSAYEYHVVEKSHKYGFIVPSGMLVLRRHGRVYVACDSK